MLSNGLIENCSFTGTIEVVHSTDDNSVVESAQVGEAKEVPLKERMDRLFPD